MNNYQRVTVGVLCIGLVACSNRPEKGIVVQEWVTNTEQLNLRPIFPPRGNFEVGDIYVVRAANAGTKMKTANYYMSSVWFDRMNLDNELIKFAPHISPAKTPEDKSGLVVPTGVPALLVPKTRTRINSLVAFPAFTFASLGEYELGLGVSNSAIGALFSGAKKSSYSVAYSVPLAETYGVGYRDALLAANTHMNKYKADNYKQLESAVISLKNEVKGDDKDTTAVLVLVTQVYLARSMDVVISSTDSSGAQLSAVTRALTDLDERKTAVEAQLRGLKSPPSKDSGAAADADGGGDGTAAAKPAAAAKAAVVPKAGDVGAKKADAPAANQAAINQKQAELAQINADIRKRVEAITPAMPGVTGSVVKSTASSLTLRQVFEYPVAIGYSGINIDIEVLKKSGNVVEKPSITTYPLKKTINVEFE